ncbi:hypothetical protein GCM10010315_40200 [Streptomyces luteosporeus]|uniref:Uncharacterized protein n=1 Tax=Streptomyces luteosporeus TaxID=173856 RepID=A0ABN3TX32_9ACTN
MLGCAGFSGLQRHLRGQGWARNGWTPGRSGGIGQGSGALMSDGCRLSGDRGASSSNGHGGSSRYRHANGTLCILPGTVRDRKGFRFSDPAVKPDAVAIDAGR